MPNFPFELTMCDVHLPIALQNLETCPEHMNSSGPHQGPPKSPVRLDLHADINVGLSRALNGRRGRISFKTKLEFRKSPSILNVACRHGLALTMLLLISHPMLPRSPPQFDAGSQGQVSRRPPPCQDGLFRFALFGYAISRKSPDQDVVYLRSALWMLVGVRLVKPGVKATELVLRQDAHQALPILYDLGLLSTRMNPKSRYSRLLSQNCVEVTRQNNRRAPR